MISTLLNEPDVVGLDAPKCVRNIVLVRVSGLLDSADHSAQSQLGVHPGNRRITAGGRDTVRKRRIDAAITDQHLDVQKFILRVLEEIRDLRLLALLRTQVGAVLELELDGLGLIQLCRVTSLLLPVLGPASRFGLLFLLGYGLDVSDFLLGYTLDFLDFLIRRVLVSIR